MKHLLLLFIFIPLFLVAQPKSSDSNFNVIPKDSSAKVKEELQTAFDQQAEAQKIKIKEALNKRKQVILAESAIIIFLSSVILVQSMKIKKLKRK